LLSGWAVDWTLGVTDWIDLLAEGGPKKLCSVRCRKEQVRAQEHREPRGNMM